MYAKALLAAFLSILSVCAQAQARFGVDDSVRLVSGGTSWGVLHHFIQANNYVGDTLQMRWRKTVKRNPPSAWTVNFADPESNHPDISNIDSVDFSFPDSASNHTFNKFVIGVKPNGAVGNGQYIFTIFEKQFPADSIQIFYNVEVYTSVEIEEMELVSAVYPNPADEYLDVLLPGSHTELSLHELSGRELVNIKLAEPQYRLGLQLIPEGIYLLKVRAENTVQVIKISIQH